MIRPVLALAVVASLALAKAARADEPVRRDPAAAEALWQQGRALRAAGKIAEACPKFEASYKLDPALGALLNLASCHELEGRIGTAWAEYKDGVEQAERAGDKKRIAFAKKRAAALEARVPRLEIVALNPPDGFVVTRDGQPLGAGALGTMLPVDPGVHTLEARAPGRVAWRRRIELLAGERQTIDVPVLARVEVPAEVAPVVAITRAPPPSEAPPPPPSNGVRNAGFVLGGVGVAGLAVGAVFGVLTGSAASSARDRCPNDACGAAGLADVDRAKSYAWVSDVGFAAGGAALVAGVVLIAIGRPARPATALSITPLVGPNGAGFGTRGAF